MIEKEIIIREAVAADAPFVALVVLMALHYDESHPLYEIFKELAARTDAQYSYCNALIAQVDGEVAGAIVGYDGARLYELREPLLALVRERQGREIEIEDETSAGEYYLDSLAVLPKFRGRGVGSMLLSSAAERAFAAGHKRVGLIVDYDNPRAEALYSSLGFECVNSTTFLGHNMWHMQKTVKGQE
ncbi:MAG: GNAT family N-acetyltransferase [Bacteroidaceae bacterium]|nr:GNAT family N-acetyltransferase [Bacteroidaceae bacterium]